jgi:hypothetical protein
MYRIMGGDSSGGPKPDENIVRSLLLLFFRSIASSKCMHTLAHILLNNARRTAPHHLPHGPSPPSLTFPLLTLSTSAFTTRLLAAKKAAVHRFMPHHYLTHQKVVLQQLTFLNSTVFVSSQLHFVLCFGFVAMQSSSVDRAGLNASETSNW